jgi:hypothetical protein
MLANAGSIQYQRWWLRAGRWIVLALALVLMGMAHVKIGGLLIAQTNNTDQRILGGDQKHNMKLALQTRADLNPDFSKGVSEPIKDWFPHRTDGVVNPLWPWIAAWLADKDHVISGPTEVTAQDRAFFNKGRWFLVGLTFGVVVIVSIGCARAFSLGGTLIVALLCEFGALLPRAAYFQPEPLYFSLFLATWVACLHALNKNSLWMHALIGVFGGLAYLAKGSVQPLLMVFAAISTLRWAWGWIETRRQGAEESTTLWLRRNHWIAMFIMGFCFLMTAGPRLSYSARAYGDPFHSYPAYWMWFDDFDSEGFAWMAAHGTKESLQSIPPTEKPSLKNYVAKHTLQQMQDRLVEGTKTKVTELFWPGVTSRSSKGPKPWKGILELRGVYLGCLAVMLAGLLIALRTATVKSTNAAQRLHPESVVHVLFVLGAFAGYALAYGWYTPIGRGDRFMLSLYAPLVLSLVWACESVMRRARRRSAGKAFVTAYHCAQWLLIAAIVWRLIEVLQFPQFKA